MNTPVRNRWSLIALSMAMALHSGAASAAEKLPSSYAPTQTDDLASVIKRMTAEKPKIAQAHKNLLEERYDLADKPAKDATMSRGKPVQDGVRVKLPEGVSWDELAKLPPDEIRERGLFPGGFLPLPHPNHPEGGMVFPHFLIEEIKKQENRDLTRFTAQIQALIDRWEK